MSGTFDPMKTRNESSQNNGGFSFNFARVKNPVIEQMKDPEDIAKMFADYRIIPYNGTDNYSSDRLLTLFNRMRTISPTLGACWFSIKSFVFQKKLTVVRSEDEDFDYGDEKIPLELSEKLQFKEKILNNVLYNVKGKKGAKRIAENCFDDLFDNGNTWLELQLTETGGMKKALINYHHSDSCRYVLIDGQEDIVAVSKKWDPDYLLKHRPDLIPSYPKFIEDENGVKRTMIHCKYGNYLHYGRPIWLGAWLNAYREYQDTDHMIKAADKRFTGQVIIEYEGEPDEEYEDFDDDNSVGREDGGGEPLMKKIEKNFTAQSDNPQTAMVMERPYKAGQVFVKEISLNLNEGFFEKEDIKNRRKVFENLSWSERLLGNDVGNAFSADSIMQELEVKDTGVLQIWRDKSVEGLNQCYEIIDEWMNGSSSLFMSIALPRLFEGKKTLKGEQVKKMIDAIGVGVRAGVITPTMEDEVNARELLNMIEMPQEAINVWKEDLTRTPITLKGEDEKQIELEVSKAKTEGEDGD